MGNSETFGVQKGHGEEIINWLNEQSKTHKGKLEARLYGYTVTTKNFGEFEMFSWIGDCLLYTSPSPRDQRGSRFPSSG